MPDDISDDGTVVVGNGVWIEGQAFMKCSEFLEKNANLEGWNNDDAAWRIYAVSGNGDVFAGAGRRKGSLLNNKSEGWYLDLRKRSQSSGNE